MVALSYRQNAPEPIIEMYKYNIYYVIKMFCDVDEDSFTISYAQK